jgi:hypothetical protein
MAALLALALAVSFLVPVGGKEAGSAQTGTRAQ